MLRAANKRLRVGEAIAEIARLERGPVHELVGDENLSHGITVAAHASANTKGSWVELGTAAIGADGFYAQVVPGNSGDDFLVDIGVGGSGSEVAIVENVYVSTYSLGNFHGPAIFYVPLPVTAGTRIAARVQATTGAAEVWVSVILARGEEYRGLRKSRATTYGANTAASRGTPIDPGGSSHTNGAWTQLSAAVTDHIRYAVAFTGPGADQARSTASWFVELGIGAAASETVNFPGMQCRCHNADDGVFPAVHQLRALWPTGSRLSARARCSITTAGDRLIDVVVIGFA